MSSAETSYDGGRMASIDDGMPHVSTTYAEFETRCRKGQWWLLRRLGCMGAAAPRVATRAHTCTAGGCSANAAMQRSLTSPARTRPSPTSVSNSRAASGCNLGAGSGRMTLPRM